MLYWIICVAQFCQLLERVIVLFSCNVVENLRILSFAMEESCFLNFFLRQYVLLLLSYYWESSKKNFHLILSYDNI